MGRTGKTVAGVIGVVIAIVIALSLMTIVVVTQNNVTSDARTPANAVPILGNVTLFYAIGVLVLGVGVIFVALRESGLGEGD